jgi:hypothetical protein
MLAEVLLNGWNVRATPFKVQFTEILNVTETSKSLTTRVVRQRRLNV